MKGGFDSCFKHGKGYQFIGSDHQCRLNCRICFECLRAVDSGHKKGVNNHQTISIQQLGSHFQKLEKYSYESISQCSQVLDNYFRGIQNMLMDQLKKQKQKLAGFVRKILLTGITKDERQLDVIIKLYNRNFADITCQEVSSVSGKLFSFVPRKNNYGFKKFIDYVNQKQSAVYNEVKDIFYGKNWNKIALNDIEKEVSFPDFGQPVKQSRVRTEEGRSAKKTMRKSLVKKDTKKSDLKDISISIKKPLELEDSKLVDGKDQTLFLGKLFENKRVRSAHLLFRASQHDFSVKEFHHLCDGQSNTLVLVKTQFGKIIGGFTSVPWKSTANTLHSDVRRDSFLFSLSLKQKMTLIDEKSAVFNSVNFGPTFGAGADLAICHNAHIEKTSYSEFPYSYGNSRYKECNQHSTSLFTGQKSGNHFLIKEWQVWKINF